jgi:acyl-CoA reductase-like NAD-dependent aldehyde dehydrogenase
VRGAAFAAFLNCGQVCTSAERFYVHEDVYDAFVDGLAAQARALRVGSGLGKVDIGPMASRRERDRVAALVDRAVAAGARVVCGAQVPAHCPRGWFYAPTVLADITPGMEILHGESFGPVAPLCKVRSLDEAIALANDSPLGLGANLYTGDLAEAMRFVAELESGIVWVNTPLNDNDAIGFGGNKLTGKNRELGAEGLEVFRRSKMVMIAPEAKADPEWFPYPDGEAYAGD